MFSVILGVVAALLVTVVQAAPVLDLDKRDVANPPITSPDATSVWIVGSTVTVTWDTSNLPTQITNTNGKIILGFMNDSTTNEHLMINSPLASGFDIRSGSTTLTVPNVDDRTDYIIALMGDSGNISPKFTIRSSSSSQQTSATNLLGNATPSTPITTSNLPGSVLSTLNPTSTDSVITPTGTSTSSDSSFSILTTLPVSQGSSSQNGNGNGPSAGSNSNSTTSSTASTGGSTSGAHQTVSFSGAHLLVPLIAIVFMI